MDDAGTAGVAAGARTGSGGTGAAHDDRVVGAAPVSSKDQGALACAASSGQSSTAVNSKSSRSRVRSSSASSADALAGASRSMPVAADLKKSFMFRRRSADAGGTVARAAVEPPAEGKRSTGVSARGDANSADDEDEDIDGDDMDGVNANEFAKSPGDCRRAESADDAELNE